MNEEAHQPTTDQAERASGAHEYGRYPEEFEVGSVYKHWPAKTITESEDHLFCLLTMNHHPLHINDVYALESPSRGRNVVAGPLRLLADVRDDRQRRLRQGDRQPGHADELTHPNPVFHGDTLFVESEVRRRGPPSRSLTAGWSRSTSRAYNQDGTLVAEFKRAVLVPPQEPRMKQE